MKVLLIEDEALAARRIKRLLENEGMEVLAHVKSNKDLQEFIKENEEPELYLMDIHLNDGVVFETLEELKLKSPIIFTTAFDQYAIKAFKENSIDYLLKPIDEEELKKAIEKFRDLRELRKLSKQESKVDLKALSHLLLNKKEKPSYRERIRVKIGDRIKSIKIAEVAMFFSEKKATYLLTEESRSYPVDYTLEEINNELDPTKFFRVSRGQVVSIDYISDVLSHSNSRLKVKILKNDQEVIVARERVKEFKDWLG